MNAHKLAAILTDDGILVLKGLPFHAGDTVEVIILEQTKNSKLTPQASVQHPLQGTVLRYDDPFQPAVPAEEWEALK